LLFFREERSNEIRFQQFPLLLQIATILDRLPTVEEYMEYAGKIDSMAADVYRYLSFDQIAEFRESAANANIPVVQA